jgi:hypothetical protein
VVGLRAADLVFDPTLACCKVDAPVPAAPGVTAGEPNGAFMARIPSSRPASEDRGLVGQGLPLSRTMLSNHKLPYVGRFACDWPRLATTDPHAAQAQCRAPPPRTPPGPVGPGGRRGEAGPLVGRPLWKSWGLFGKLSLRQEAARRRSARNRGQLLHRHAAATLPQHPDRGSGAGHPPPGRGWRRDLRGAAPRRRRRRAGPPGLGPALRPPPPCAGPARGLGLDL